MSNIPEGWQIATMFDQASTECLHDDGVSDCSMLDFASFGAPRLVRDALDLIKLMTEAVNEMKEVHKWTGEFPFPLLWKKVGDDWFMYHQGRAEFVIHLQPLRAP